MATDAQNLKLNKVTAASKTAFNSATPASGSIYWDESEKRVVVGDGATAGGVPMAQKGEVTALATSKLNTAELETALKELIVEFGGTVPQ